MNAEGREYPMVAELTRPHNPNTMHGTFALGALHVQKLIDAAGPEYYERVTWHPAYMRQRADLLQMAQSPHVTVKEVQAGWRALWVLVNQLIDGTYATSELQGGPSDGRAA